MDSSLPGLPVKLIPAGIKTSTNLFFSTPVQVGNPQKPDYTMLLRQDWTPWMKVPKGIAG